MGSQVLEKHINQETNRDVMDGTNDKSSSKSTILGDDGKESEKIDDKRDIFETETNVLQSEVCKIYINVQSILAEMGVIN